jgi:hypothetical protein
VVRSNPPCLDWQEYHKKLCFPFNVSRVTIKFLNIQRLRNILTTDKIILTLNLLTTTIVAPPSNASKWQMGFNSAFKGLKYYYIVH